MFVVKTDEAQAWIPEAVHQLILPAVATTLKDSAGIYDRCHQKSPRLKLAGSTNWDVRVGIQGLWILTSL